MTLLRERSDRGQAQPSARGGLLTGLLRTARPKQWVKNVLVAAAPAAAGDLFTTHALAQLALVFVLFTACAAAVYLVNDARDAEADRAHPVKCRRPVAAGQVPVPVAYTAGITLGVLAPAAAALLCPPELAALLAGYLVMQLAYCVSLKHVLVVDLAVVTAGFVMRATAAGSPSASRCPAGSSSPPASAPCSWSPPSATRGRAARRERRRHARAAHRVHHRLPAVRMAARGRGRRPRLLPVGPGGGGVPHTSVLPWRQLSVVAFVLAVLRYAVFADRGTAGEPEDVVLGDRALALIGLVWAAMYAAAVADW